MGFKVFTWIILVPCLLFGFRVIPGLQTWDIDSTSVTNSKLFLVFENGTESLTNDLTGDDPLAGPATVTIQQVMNAIMNDYNNIQGAFITLADRTDPDFATRGENRTITVTNGAAIGLTSGGYARPIMKSGKIVGCDIVMTSAYFKTSTLLTRGITHEVGHCLGLNHPMDTTKAVMSYYYDSQPNNRLQIDDKMGILYLYPTDPQGAKEQPTLGLSCARTQ